MKKIILLLLLFTSGCMSNGFRDYGPPGKIIRKETGTFLGTTTYYMVIEPSNGEPNWRFQLSADEYERYEVGNFIYWEK